MHDFIGVIFYYFRQAVPTALAGLAAGAALVAALDLLPDKEENADSRDILQTALYTASAHVRKRSRAIKQVKAAAPRYSVNKSIEKNDHLSRRNHQSI